MYKLFKKMVLAGLGLQSRANEILDEWAKEGERNQRKEAKRIKEFLVRFEKDAESAEEKIGGLYKKVISRIDLPSREELNRLSKKIDDLVSRFEHTQKAK